MKHPDRIEYLSPRIARKSLWDRTLEWMPEVAGIVSVVVLIILYYVIS